MMVVPVSLYRWSRHLITISLLKRIRRSYRNCRTFGTISLNEAQQIRIVRGEANSVLQAWCERMNWRHNRAVVFLDPYGMSVNWQTIEALGDTGSIDLWVLLPIGQAINRLLTRQGPPTGAWADKLTTFFGTDEWIGIFLPAPPAEKPIW